MAEYIDQNDTIDVLDRVCKACNNDNCYRHKGRAYCPVMTVIDGIKDLPTADVQPVRRGRWIDIYEYCEMNGYRPSGMAIYYWCSECMREQEKTSDFCPCCGADMRSPEAIKG